MKIGEVLRAHRETAGLSQRELSKRAGVGANVVHGIESGTRPDPRWTTVCKLVKVLGRDLLRDALRGAV